MSLSSPCLCRVDVHDHGFAQREREQARGGEM